MSHYFISMQEDGKPSLQSRRFGLRKLGSMNLTLVGNQVDPQEHADEHLYSSSSSPGSSTIASQVSSDSSSHSEEYSQSKPDSFIDSDLSDNCETDFKKKRRRVIRFVLNPPRPELILYLPSPNRFKNIKLE